jgi:hypothetical protein
MRHAGVLAVGFCLGILLAGPVAAVLVWSVPPHVRGAAVVWAVTAVTVGATMAAAWVWRARRRD